MSTKGFTLLVLILASVISASKIKGDMGELLKIEQQKNTFNTSTDLLFLNRNKENPEKQKDNIQRIFVIGDFGSYDHYRDLSTNTDMMNSLATQYEYDHIITVGDNIYPAGIENINNRWKAWLVMTAFKKSALKDILIYPTLGNHDCYSNYFNELKFSKYDYQWRLEEEYYVKVTPLKDNPNKQFVNLMLNSWKTICPPGNPYKGDDNECGRFQFKAGGPEVAAHYQWIEEQLKKYSEDPKTAWMAVTMHHQPYVHPGMKVSLIPLLRKYGVDIMIVGHEHWLEYSNQEYDHEWRFMDVEYGPVILNCTDREILFTGTREVHDTYGQRFHQFTIGHVVGFMNDPTCPVADMDVNLKWRSTLHPGHMTIEMTEDLFKATFIYSDGTTAYRVFLHKPETSE